MWERGPADGATEQADADSRDWRTDMDLLSMRLAD
jgi:hypothetical protein